MGFVLNAQSNYFDYTTSFLSYKSQIFILIMDDNLGCAGKENYDSSLHVDDHLRQKLAFYGKVYILCVKIYRKV